MPLKYPENPLRTFDPILFAYKGIGELRTSRSTFNCRFEAIQMRTGNVLVVCEELICTTRAGLLPDDDPTITLLGTTDDGRVLEASGDPMVVDQWISSHSAPRATIRFRCFSVHDRGGAALALIRYGITNFLFVGTTPDTDTGGLILQLNLVAFERQVTAKIRRLPTYDAITRSMTALRGPDVAAEVEFSAQDVSVVEAETLVDDLCHVLSVARGTVVQWIYRTDVAAGGETSAHHFSRITKPYTPAAPFHHGAEARELTKLFVETAFPNFQRLKRRYALDTGTVALYLDGKLETDYLESRAVKLVIAVEMLKATFLDGLPATEEYCCEPEVFDAVAERLRASMKEAISGAGIPSKVRGDITARGKVNGLNRKSFKAVLQRMLKDIGLQVAEPELSLFIRCRDSLVHRGRYYCETATRADREACPPRSDPVAEHDFLEDFVDRLYLRLVGYTGDYINFYGERRRVQSEGVAET